MRWKNPRKTALMGGALAALAALPLAVGMNPVTAAPADDGDGLPGVEVIARGLNGPRELQRPPLGNVLGRRGRHRPDRPGRTVERRGLDDRRRIRHPPGRRADQPR